MTRIEELGQNESDIKDMTVKEFSTLAHSTVIEVRSGYNGKILCKNYNPRKHKDISDRKIISVWSEIRVTGSSGFTNFAKPIICVFVLGDVEYDSEKGVKIDD